MRERELSVLPTDGERRNAFVQVLHGTETGGQFCFFYEGGEWSAVAVEPEHDECGIEVVVQTKGGQTLKLFLGLNDPVPPEDLALALARAAAREKS